MILGAEDGGLKLKEPEITQCPARNGKLHVPDHPIIQ